VTTDFSTVTSSLYTDSYRERFSRKGAVIQKAVQQFSLVVQC
jgi:hypothetical protein